MTRQAAMKQLCESLKADVDQIIGLWEAAAKREPWILLPQQDRTDSIPECLERIADAVVCGPTDRQALIALAVSAAKHGRHRADLGMPDTLLLSEYYLLREAVWSYFRLRGDGLDDVVSLLSRIDVAITLSTRASMLGYHREQLDRAGRWEGTIEALVDGAPL